MEGRSPQNGPFLGTPMSLARDQKKQALQVETIRPDIFEIAQEFGKNCAWITGNTDIIPR